MDDYLDDDTVLDLILELELPDEDDLDGYGCGKRPSVAELDQMRLTVTQASRVSDEWAVAYLSDVGRLLIAYDDAMAEVRHYQRAFYRAAGEKATLESRLGRAG